MNSQTEEARQENSTDSGGSALGPGAQTLQVVATPSPKISRSTLDTLWSIDSQEKISKFDSTRRDILRLKCTKFEFGSAQTPRGELTALLQTL